MRSHGFCLRIPSKLLGGLFASLFLLSAGLMAQHQFNLPPPNTTSFDSAIVIPNPDGVTYVSVTLSGVPGGYDITNKTYDAWCLDVFGHINPPYTFVAYDSYAGVNGDHNPIPPANVEFGGQVAWNETNWVINHPHGNNNDLPQATVTEVQDAIWTLQDPFYNSGFNDNITTALLQEAQQNGTNFIPAPGQVQAIILYADGIQSGPSNQDLIIFDPVPGQPVLTCPTSTGTVGIPYSSQLVVTGGVGPYTFSITSGSLPPGLTLNPTTGAITGTPTSAGPFSFTAQVVDSTGAIGTTGSSGCTITIASQPPPPPQISCPPNTTPGEVGVPFSVTVPGTGGAAPLTFSIASGSLPAGLTLNTSTGVISGTPTAAGSASFTITVVDALGRSATTTGCTITITPAPVPQCPSLTSGEVNVAYNSSITVQSGTGTPPFTYAIVSGTLPPGLTLNASTGAITGTPTSAGTYSFTIQVTDANGVVVTLKCTITITSTPPTPPDVFEVNYFRNLNTNASIVNGGISGVTSPEEYVDIVNPGTNGASIGSETNGVGDLCASIYVVDENEEMEECCSCLVTPDQLIEIPVQANLLSNPNNGVPLHNGVIKIIKSLPVSGGTTCDPTNPVPTPTLVAWITHTRAYPAGGDDVPPANLGVTESLFQVAPLSAGEQSFLSSTCENIHTQSSGKGTCTCPPVLPK